MRIFFDVDYTILAPDYRLRTGTRDVFERLVADGHEVHVWSGEGRRHKVLRDHGLDDLVTGVYEKPIGDYLRRLERLGVDVMPDFVIDDYPEIVGIFGGFHVRDFHLGVTEDDEMEQVYAAICEWVDRGTSSHRQWRPRHPNFDEMLAGVQAAAAAAAAAGTGGTPTSGTQTTGATAGGPTVDTFSDDLPDGWTRLS